MAVLQRLLVVVGRCKISPRVFPALPSAVFRSPSFPGDCRDRDRPCLTGTESGPLNRVRKPSQRIRPNPGSKWREIRNVRFESLHVGSRGLRDAIPSGMSNQRTGKPFPLRYMVQKRGNAPRQLLCLCSVPSIRTRVVHSKTLQRKPRARWPARRT